MSKSIKVLLLTLLALCLAVGAAFAEGETPLTINLDAGKADDTTPVNVLTGKATTALTFSAAAKTSATQDEAAAAVVLVTATGTTGVTKVEIAEDGTFTAKNGNNDAEGTLSFNTTSNKLEFTGTDEGAQATALTFCDVGDGDQAAAAKIVLATPSANEDVTTIEIAEDGTFTAKNGNNDAEGTLTFDASNNKLMFMATAEETFTLAAGQQLTGNVILAATDEEDDYHEDTFELSEEAVLAGTNDNDDEVKITISAGTPFTFTSNDTTGKYTLTFTGGAGVTVVDNGNEVGYSFTDQTLTGSEDVQPAVAAAFDSADITVFANGKGMGTVTFTSAEPVQTVTVSTDVTVSFDLAKVSFDLVSVDGKGKTSADLKVASYVFSVDIEDTSKDVYIYFTSGDASFEATLKIKVDSSSSATSETYLLKVSDITLTPANAVTNTAKLISADTDNYSATLDLANLDSTASGDWGSFAEFTASSDYLGGSFSVTVSTDAKLVNVYVKNGTTWDEVDTEEVSGKVITPNTIGTYKVVLSADLVASGDASTTSGDAYFAFDFKVVSVDASKSEEAAQDVVTDAANASADATGGVGGNPIISAGQKIDTKFLSGTAISPSAFASFFSSATTVTMLSETELAAALETLGLDEDDMGDSENGYKALAFGLPSGFTLTANEKFFVLLTTNENGTGTNRLGVGVVSPKLNGSRTMVIVFKLLKNPAHTADFMTFDAGEYFVGATNDTASADTSSSTRAVFVTAGGTFNIKSDEATLLQGQTASGTATPYEGDDDDDDQETSSHGSSSGCDAGFGALALLAVAGALAVRKVRK